MIKKKEGRNPPNSITNTLFPQCKGQVVILMGVTLALAVFVIAAIPMQLTDLDVAVTSERAHAIFPEFQHIKTAFGTNLNYNLATIQFDSSNRNSTYAGNPNDLPAAFNHTRDSFHVFELKHGIFFDATLVDYWYSHLTAQGHIFHVKVRFTLDDGTTCIRDDATYSILLKIIQAS